MYNQFYLKYNITHRRLTFADGETRKIVVVNKDTALFAIQFVESKTNVEKPVNLTGVNALDLVCDQYLGEAAPLLFSQSVYNQGDDATYEDLANGKVTHAVNFDTAAISTFLGSKSEVFPVIEYSVLDSQNRPQTLTPGGINITIVPGVDQSV